MWRVSARAADLGMQVPSSCGWSPLSFHTKHRHPPVKAFLESCSSIQARVIAPDLYTDNIHRDLCTLWQFLMNVWVVYLYQTILLYDAELYCHHTPTWATSYEESCLTPSDGEWIRILYFQQSSPWNSPPCTYTYTPCFLVNIRVGYKRGETIAMAEPKIQPYFLPKWKKYEDWEVQNVMMAPSFGAIETQGPIFLLYHVFKVTLWSTIGNYTTAGKDKVQAGRRKTGKKSKLRASPSWCGSL